MAMELGRSFTVVGSLNERGGLLFPHKLFTTMRQNGLTRIKTLAYLTTTCGEDKSTIPSKWYSMCEPLHNPAEDTG